MTVFQFVVLLVLLALCFLFVAYDVPGCFWLDRCVWR
jgi:hypothetical protein